MRLITSLIIVGVVGSVAIGGVKSFLGRMESSPFRKVAEMLGNDRIMTIRLIEKSTFECMPGLAKIQNKKMRTLLSRVIVLSISSVDSGKTKEENRAIVMKELQPALENASERDMALFAKAFDQTKDEKSKNVACIAQTVVNLAVNKPKPLLSDAKLRGT